MVLVLFLSYPSVVCSDAGIVLLVLLLFNYLVLLLFSTFKLVNVCN